MAGFLFADVSDVWYIVGTSAFSLADLLSPMQLAPHATPGSAAPVLSALIDIPGHAGARGAVP